MSLPVTEAEKSQCAKTLRRRIGTENVVSTACPVCQVRFAMLAKVYADVSRLRCTLCGWTGDGELKC